MRAKIDKRMVTIRSIVIRKPISYIVRTKIQYLKWHTNSNHWELLGEFCVYRFLTGSVDRTIRLWDLRTDQCQQTFWGHEADVNSLAFHPCGNNFVTCSEDKTSRLWDLRSDQEITVFKPPSPNSSFTSTGLSSSGRILFCSSDDSSIHMWDLINNDHLGNLCGHENRITQLSVAPSGIGIVSSSWDNSVRCWGL